MCVCFFFFFVLASSAFPSPLRSNVEVGAIVWSTVDKLFPRFVWHTFLLLRFLENSSAFWRHFFFFFFLFKLCFPVLFSILFWRSLVAVLFFFF